MSFLFRSYNDDPAKSESVSIVERQLDAMSEIYARLIRSCHGKCIPSTYPDSDLNKGESVCIDRCVAKFLKSHMMLVEFLNKKDQEMSGAQISPLQK